ncbi:MAG: LCP family protein [Ruminococcus sp.]|nr:LCP family protein [Ruminococcus sp.]
MKKQSDNNADLILDCDYNSLIEEKENFADLVLNPSGHMNNPGEKKDFDGIVVSQKRKSRGKRKGKKSPHKKKMKRWKKVLITIMSVILSLLIICLGAFGIMYSLGRSSLLDTSSMKLTPPDKDTQVIDNGNYILYNGHTYRYKDTMTSILFMGIDKEELGTVNDVVGTGGQADALYLVAIDTENGLTNTFQISRSTMVDINLYNTDGDFLSTENAQICLSYAYGDGKETSAENTITSVRRMFYGLPVAQSYLALDIEGISALNDSIGGVTVTSPVDLQKADGSYVYKQGESYTLMGDSAESFVRSRDLSKLDSNTNRMARQKTYLDAFIAKTVDMTKESITTPITLYNTASPYMVTDISASKVSYLAVDLLRKGITSASIQRVPGKDKEGELYSEYHINNKKFFKMLVDTFYIQVD